MFYSVGKYLGQPCRRGLFAANSQWLELPGYPLLLRCQQRSSEVQLRLRRANGSRELARVAPPPFGRAAQTRWLSAAADNQAGSRMTTWAGRARSSSRTDRDDVPLGL